MDQITVNTHLLRQVVPVKFIRVDEMQNFFSQSLAKHRQQSQLGMILSSSGNGGAANLKTMTPSHLVCAINLATNRIVRMSGKVWDQLASDADVWLVTNQEWQEYCDKVLDQEQCYRHGRKVISKHPTSLNPDKLHHFISQFYDGNRPVDPMRRFTLPPPTANTPLMMKSMMSSGGPLSPLDGHTRTSPLRGSKANIPERNQSPSKLSPALSIGGNDKALINAVKAALSSSSKNATKKNLVPPLPNLMPASAKPVNKPAAKTSGKPASSASSTASSRRKPSKAIMTNIESKQNALKEKLHNSPVHELPPPPPFLFEHELVDKSDDDDDDDDGVCSNRPNGNDHVFQCADDAPSDELSPSEEDNVEGDNNSHSQLQHEAVNDECLHEALSGPQDTSDDESSEHQKNDLSSSFSSHSSHSSFLPLDPNEYMDSSSDGEEEESAIQQYYVDLVGSINHGDFQSSPEEVAHLAEQLLEKWREQQQYQQALSEKNCDELQNQVVEEEVSAALDGVKVINTQDDISSKLNPVNLSPQSLQKMDIAELLVDNDLVTTIQESEAHDELQNTQEEESGGSPVVEREEPYEIQQARIFERLNQELLDIIQQDLMKGSRESFQDNESFDGSTIQTFPEDYSHHSQSRSRCDDSGAGESLTPSRVLYNNSTGRLSLSKYSPLSAVGGDVLQTSEETCDNHQHSDSELSIEEVEQQQLVFKDSFDEEEDTPLDEMPPYVDNAISEEPLLEQQNDGFLKDAARAEILESHNVQQQFDNCEPNVGTAVDEKCKEQSTGTELNVTSTDTPVIDEIIVTVSKNTESRNVGVIPEEGTEVNGVLETTGAEVVESFESDDIDLNPEINKSLDSEKASKHNETDCVSNPSVAGENEDGDEDKHSAVDDDVVELSSTIDGTENVAQTDPSVTSVSEVPFPLIDGEDSTDLLDCSEGGHEGELIHIVLESTALVGAADSNGNMILEASPNLTQLDLESVGVCDHHGLEGMGINGVKVDSKVEEIDEINVLIESLSVTSVLPPEGDIMEVEERLSHVNLEGTVSEFGGNLIISSHVVDDTPDNEIVAIEQAESTNKIETISIFAENPDFVVSELENSNYLENDEGNEMKISAVPMALEDPLAMVAHPSCEGVDMVSSSLATIEVLDAATSEVTIQRSNSSEELRKQLKEKSEQLEAAMKEKAALEARLEETRYLLQVFAGINRNQTPSLSPLAPANALNDNMLGAGISSSDGYGMGSTFPRDYASSIPVRQPSNISSQSRRRAWSEESIDSSEAERYFLPQRNAPIRRRPSTESRNKLNSNNHGAPRGSDSLDGQRSPGTARVVPLTDASDDDDSFSMTSSSSHHSRSSSSSAQRGEPSDSSPSYLSDPPRPLPAAQSPTIGAASSAIRQLLNRSSSNEDEDINSRSGSVSIIPTAMERHDSEISLDQSLRGESNLITPKYNFVESLLTLAPSVIYCQESGHFVNDAVDDGEETGTTQSLPSNPMLQSSSMEENFLIGEPTVLESDSIDDQCQNGDITPRGSTLDSGSDCDNLSLGSLSRSISTSHSHSRSQSPPFSDNIHSEDELRDECTPETSNIFESVPPVIELCHLSPAENSMSSSESQQPLSIPKSTSLMKKIAALHHKKRDFETEHEESPTMQQVTSNSNPPQDEFRDLELNINRLEEFSVDGAKDYTTKIGDVEGDVELETTEVVESGTEDGESGILLVPVQVPVQEAVPKEEDETIINESVSNDIAVDISPDIKNPSFQDVPDVNVVNDNVDQEEALQADPEHQEKIQDIASEVEVRIIHDIDTIVHECVDEVFTVQSEEVPMNGGVSIDASIDSLNNDSECEEIAAEEHKDQHNDTSDCISMSDKAVDPNVTADEVPEVRVEAVAENDLTTDRSIGNQEDLQLPSEDDGGNSSVNDSRVMDSDTDEVNDADIVTGLPAECSTSDKEKVDESQITENEFVKNSYEENVDDGAQENMEVSVGEDIGNSNLQQNENEGDEDIDNPSLQNQDLVTSNIDNETETPAVVDISDPASSQCNEVIDATAPTELAVNNVETNMSVAHVEESISTFGNDAVEVKLIDATGSFEEPIGIDKNISGTAEDENAACTSNIDASHDRAAQTLQEEIEDTSEVPPPPPPPDLEEDIGVSVNAAEENVDVQTSAPPSPVKQEETIVGETTGVDAEIEINSPLVTPPPPLSPYPEDLEPQPGHDPVRTFKMEHVDDSEDIVVSVIDVPMDEVENRETVVCETSEAQLLQVTEKQEDLSQRPVEASDSLVNQSETESDSTLHSPTEKIVAETVVNLDAASLVPPPPPLSPVNSPLQEIIKSLTVNIDLAPPDAAACSSGAPSDSDFAMDVVTVRNALVETPKSSPQIIDQCSTPSSITNLSDAIHPSINPFEQPSLDDFVMMDNFDRSGGVDGVSLDIGLDPYQSLCRYFKPFLITAKFYENPTIRGYKARRQLIESISDDEILFWIIFQMYGTTDGIMTKHIKTIQISRALKDAKVANLTPSQLDLMLVKVHAKLAAASVAVTAKPPSSPASKLMSPQPTGMAKTGTLIIGSAGKKSVNGTPRGDTSNSNTANFTAYVELLNALAYGVIGESSKSRANSNSAFSYLKLKEGFMDLLKSRDLSIYNKLYVEYQFYMSGILTKSIYSKLLLNHNSGRRLTEWVEIAQKLNISIHTETDLDQARLIWERNADQIRLIYTYYAGSVETRRIGQGPVKLMMSLDNCKEMLQDFEVLPQLIDVQNFYRIFRSCKLWEWELADSVIRMMAYVSSGSNQSFDMTLLGDVADNRSIVSSVNSQMTGRNSLMAVNEYDPYDIRGTIGNYSLSLYGFVELLTRIACFQNKLGSTVHTSLENIMHLMDASDGKSKLLRSSRKSVSVRHFVYGDK